MPRLNPDMALRLSPRHARSLAVFAPVALVNAMLLWYFHDRHWYPSDEGIYATIAQRVLAGEVMNLQVQNFHPGYGDFLNASAFRVFGLDLVSLRYPLVFGAFLQSCVVYALLCRRSLLLAACGSVAVTAIGVIQFLNPTPHWYCLFLSTVLVYWLIEAPREHWVRLVGAGVLIGTVTLFRQLTGVFLAMAVLVVALRECSTDARGRRAWLARALLLTVLVGLLAYLALSRGTEPGGLLLFASWPLAILGLALWDTRTTNRDAAIVVARLAGGVALSALPLLLYCLVHRSFQAWLGDAVLAALWLPRLDLFLEAGSWYGALPIAGLYQAVMPSAPSDIANGLYWTLLPLLASANGIYTLARLRADRARTPALPVVAAFYALTVLYMQNPIYLYFTAGLSLTAVLWLNAETSRARQAVFAVGAVFLSLVAVAFHAGQPFSRTNAELLHGRNVVTGIFADPFPRVGLRLHPAEQYPYRTLASVIQAEVPDGEPIFALPSDAELYFLADRPNPFRFYNTALGVRTDTELSTILDRLRRQPPRVITFRPADKYNTSASHAIMRYVRSRYDLVEDVGGVEVYRIRPTFGRNQPMVTGWSSSFARWNQDLKAEGPVRDWYR